MSSTQKEKEKKNLEWRENLHAMIEKYPNQYIDVIDAAWLQGFEDGKKESFASYQAGVREEALKMKQKWTRPMLDTVVGKDTAEIVGTIGEHIADDFISLLTTHEGKKE